MVKTTKITVETDTVMIVRHAKTASAWCPDCRAEVDVITLDNDSLQELIAAAHIQEWLGSGKLHFWQKPNEPARICVSSLLQCFELAELRKIVVPRRTL